MFKSVVNHYNFFEKSLKNKTNEAFHRNLPHHTNYFETVGKNLIPIFNKKKYTNILLWTTLLTCSASLIFIHKTIAIISVLYIVCTNLLALIQLKKTETAQYKSIIETNKLLHLTKTIINSISSIKSKQLNTIFFTKWLNSQTKLHNHKKSEVTPQLKLELLTITLTIIFGIYVAFLLSTGFQQTSLTIAELITTTLITIFIIYTNNSSSRTIKLYTKYKIQKDFFINNSFQNQFSDKEEPSIIKLKKTIELQSIEFIDKFSNTILIKPINLTIHASDQLGIVKDESQSAPILSKIIAGLTLPSNGSIYYDNKTKSELEEKNIDINIIYCSELDQIHGNSLEEVLLSEEKHINTLLESLELTHYFNKQSIPTNPTSKSTHALTKKTISHTNKQLLVILRALLSTPSIIIINQFQPLPKKITASISNHLRKTNTTAIWLDSNPKHLSHCNSIITLSQSILTILSSPKSKKLKVKP